MKRYETLDWLRGLMALSIMIYHLVSWKIFHPESGTVLGNFGTYGVSIFFVLSGLSMAIVYHNYIKDSVSSIFFFLRRIFRIWPLLWACIILIAILDYVLYGKFDLYKTFLNLTTLFGFIAPDQYMNTGAWSIGNEMVYYAFTPFIIAAYNYKKSIGNFIVLLSILIGIYFSFFILDPSHPMKDQWSSYVNPFNNLFLYCSGIALYYNFKDMSLKYSPILLIVLSMMVFAFYPVAGDQINITTGFNRLIFATAAICLTLGFYKLTLTPHTFISKPLANLGEATYGVYLLHPFVYVFVSKLIDNSLATILLTSIFTIIAANISYRIYEKPFIKLGKKLTTFESKSVERVSQ